MNQYRLFVYATQLIQLGHPKPAGKALADIIKFMTGRIKSSRRQKSIEKLKGKIWHLNEYELSNVKLPATSGLGQAITLLKTVLNGHRPEYIRQVIVSVVENLK